MEEIKSVPFNVKKFRAICDEMSNTYERKNKDYGDSFNKVRAKYPNAILIRLNDKLSRLESLMDPNAVRCVLDESLEDTLLDIANYCVMELVARKMDTLNKIMERHDD